MAPQVSQGLQLACKALTWPACRPSSHQAHRTNGSPPATQNWVLPGRQCTLFSSRRPRLLRQASRRRAPPPGSRRSKCRTSPSVGSGRVEGIDGEIQGPKHQQQEAARPMTSCDCCAGRSVSACPSASCGHHPSPAAVPPRPSRRQPTLSTAEEAGGRVRL